MKLIADSGSTKTDWVLAAEGAIIARYSTQGINPYHQSTDAIRAVLSAELLPQCGAIAPFSVPAGTAASDVGAVCGALDVRFYGSGLRPEQQPVLAGLLAEVLPGARSIEAHSDLLGVARALCRHDEGIACILGTGANSGLYDGRSIVQNTPPLGYILGDEGSGAVMGRLFLNALYKGFLPKAVAADFQSSLQLTQGDVIDRVYRQPLANRFLASLAPFISSHIAVPEVRQLVVGNFRDFFRRNVAPYGRRDLAVHFVGSIACYFARELAEAARLEGFSIGRVEKSPLEGLVAYE